MEFFSWIATNAWWPTWSNLKWFDKRVDVPVLNEHKPITLTEIKKLCSTLYNSPAYKWTADGADELWDSMCPPPYNYQRWCAGSLLDDCDGFAALVLHCLHSVKIKASLLAICESTDGHCVTIFRFCNKWYIADYSTVYGPYKTAEGAIGDYNKTYIRLYNGGKGSVEYNGIINYDYKNQKFVSSSISEISKADQSFWTNLGF